MRSTRFPELELPTPRNKRPASPTAATVNGEGPGTELSSILASIGIHAKNCPCKARMGQMNQWGVGGCNEHFHEIVGWMRDGQHQWGWAEKIKAAALAVANGLALTINPFDPFPGLVSEAIRRADEKTQKKKPEQAKALRVSPVDADLIEPHFSVDWNGEIGSKLTGRKFNASTIPWKDGYATAFRLVQNGDDNVYVSLRNSELAEQSYHRLELSHRLCSHRREDPRLFWHRGKWWVSIIGVQIEQKWVAHQLYAELDDNLRAVPGKIWSADYAQRGLWEKNWGFFDHGGELYAVYTIDPHVVLKIDRSNVIDVHTHNWKPNWTGGLLRGGAAPVLVGDEYYSFFHGRIKIGRTNYYATGCYTFESKPPFEPLRLTQKPFLVPDESSRTNQKLSVLFTCGAFLQDGRWVLTSGVHDSWVNVAWIPADQIEAKLRPV